MNYQNEIYFFANKRKVFKHLAYAVGLTILCIAIFLNARGYFSNRIHLTISIWSLVGIAGSLAFVYINIRKLQSKKPLLQLNDLGILSKLTPVAKAIGCVAWKDINEFKITQVQSVSNSTNQSIAVLDNVITVCVSNPADYYNKIQNRILIDAVKKSSEDAGNFGAIIHLPVSELDCTLNSLLDILKAMHTKEIIDESLPENDNT